MNNKKIPYGLHEITKKDIASVVQVLKESSLTYKCKVPEFESLYVKKFNLHMLLQLIVQKRSAFIMLSFGIKKELFMDNTNFFRFII